MNDDDLTPIPNRITKFELRQLEIALELAIQDYAEDHYKMNDNDVQGFIDKAKEMYIQRATERIFFFNDPCIQPDYL